MKVKINRQSIHKPGWSTMAMVALLGLVALSLLACAQAVQSFGDDQISLRREDPLKTTVAPKLVYAGKEAGENQKLPRAFYGAPPMIPHSVAETELTVKTNDCLDCHGEADKDTPGMPPSHRIKSQFKDSKRAQAQQGMVTTFTGYGKADVVSGSRYNCLLCHAPQAANTPELIGNSFQGVTPKAQQKDVLDQLNSTGKY